MPRVQKTKAVSTTTPNKTTTIANKRKRGEEESPAVQELPQDSSPNRSSKRTRISQTPTNGIKSPITPRSSRTSAIHVTVTEVKAEVKVSVKSPGRKSKAEEEDEDEGDTAKAKRQRKSQAQKDEEAMPLAARTIGSKMFVGAHTSIAKGVENAIHNSIHIGGNAFACFLKSQRKWDNPPLKDENREAFRKALIEHKYDAGKHIVPHGSYLVNLATEDKDKSKQSYDAFIDDLRRCEALGIKYYNFHPGGAGQSPVGEAITRLANHLNRALSETRTVVPLLENMAGHGTLIGGRFSDLRDVIAQIKPEYRSRIGVCIDTCHAFAAGYDLRTPDAFEKTMKEFDETIGFQYLKAMHLNDSKAPFNSHRDLHQNIGLGFLGLRAFHSVMNEPRFQGLPLILETPSEKPDPKDPKGKKMIEDKTVWAEEIKLLEGLIGMDPEGDQFRSLEKALSARGRKEREEMQKKFEEKQEKEKKKLAKEREKGQKSLSDMFGAKGKNKKKVGTASKKGKKGGDDSDGSELSDLSDDEASHVH
ncbi:hypothetical protein B0A52_09190 [Exophiala mesophila]|uniref:Apurinic-apyrimidinic endonuclease 1 n=1 Tax=Exophiala mesophila TaxID=212818 RepID=A0A438MTF1_EXOME|nr:hypothetical protein B0A52_09190 [Exophiala mesophila]